MSNEESGKPIVLDECRRCGTKNAQGIEYYWEGGVEFHCDTCGRKMLLGYDEQTNAQQVEGIRDIERMNENRTRYHNELDVKFGEDYAKARENLEAEPDVLEAMAPIFGGPISQNKTLAKKGEFDAEEKEFIMK